MAARFHELTVAEIVRDTPDAVAIGFAVPPELQDEFAFRPGQYLTLSAEIEGEEARRSYSICSTPGDPHLRVGVKKVADGRFSRVVTETEREMFGSPSNSAREIEDFPAPDGEANTSMTPRRASSAIGQLLQVLHLLAELVDHCLEVEADRRQLHGIGLGAEGIRFAVKFL